jgi:hypothetical protein
MSDVTNAANLLAKADLTPQPSPATEPADEKGDGPKTTPDSSSWGSMGGSTAGAAVGTLLGGPAGAAIGGAVGGALGGAVSRLGAVPTGPGATIESGTVGAAAAPTPSEAALPVAASLQHLAFQGMIQRPMANGMGKSF